MKVLITGHGIDALVANYVLADLGYSPTIVTPHPTADAIMFTHGPWRHTGSSPLLARMLEDLELEHEEYSMTVALDGEDWSGRRAISAMQTSQHTLFDRFPDIKRTLDGGDQGIFFDAGKLVQELREIASLPDAAIKGRPIMVRDSKMWYSNMHGDPGCAIASRLVEFDHMIVTDRPTLDLLSIDSGVQMPANDQAVYKIKDASFSGKRFDVNYYADGIVVRVTTRGDITYVQTRGHATDRVIAQFGGKRMGHESLIRGLDVERCEPTSISLPQGVRLLGSATTGIDQTISDVMDVAYKWGKQWQ